MARCLEFGADLPIYKWSREAIKGSPDAKRAGLLSLAGTHLIHRVGRVRHDHV
jgi:hypothetical protein